STSDQALEGVGPGVRFGTLSTTHRRIRGDAEMKRLSLVSWLVAALFVAACGSTGGGGTSGNSYSGKTIKIGAILSITGAGGVYGPQSRDGANLAVKQI